MSSANSKRVPKLILAAIVVTSLAIFTGCGKTEPPPGPPPGVGGGVPVPGPIPGIGCISPNGPIGFTATNIHYVPWAEIVAGQIPPNGGSALFTRFAGQSQGQVSVQPGVAYPAQNPYAYNPYGGNSLQGMGYTGSISINVTPQNSTPNYNNSLGGYYGSDLANATGVITPNPSYVNPSYMNPSQGYPQGYPSYPSYPGYQSYPGYLPMQPTQPVTPQGCVTGVAIALNISGGTLFSGNVYLYLNNTGHGIVLEF